MAIYTGKINMIDKVVVTNGSTSEEMDYVYVTNAAGKRELVFEQKPPAPDDNTQTNPPIMRKWSANIKGDVTGRLFWSDLLQKRFISEAFAFGTRFYASYTYQVAPALSLKADGKGGYTFSPMTGIRGNGWMRFQSYLRHPTEGELSDLGIHAPYTGSSAYTPVNNQVSGEPLVSDGEGIRAQMSCYRYRYSGKTSINITSSTPNGTYYLDAANKGLLEQLGTPVTPSSFPFITSTVVSLKRTSDYDEITVTGGSSLDGKTKDAGYIIRLNKNIVSKEEPPMSELVEVTNITRGIGGNPKAFRMGDEVNFTVDVKGEYI